MKIFKTIMFLLAFIATMQVILLFRTERLIRTVEEFEPEVKVETKIETKPVKVETKTEPVKVVSDLISIPIQEVEFEIQPRIDCRLDDETQRMIFEKCIEYDIDFAFAMAVMFRESSFRPNVTSYNGSSVGLMQINKINHKWLSEELGITDFFDPEQNVTAGLYMLRDLFDKYDDPAAVLMAYNMGETGAKRYWNKGIYSTDYAEDILQQADKYKAEIAERMGESVLHG